MTHRNAGVAANPVQANFFRRIGNVSAFFDLLNFFPSAFFFAKDENSRIVWVSQSKRERLGVQQESDLVGKTDHDFFPKHVADGFVRDDRQVMRTKRPLHRRAELWFSWDRRLQWSVTTKVPIQDSQGNAMGVFGFVENATTKLAAAETSSLGKAIHFVEENHRRGLSVGEIAAAAHLSERQLLRLFQQEFGLSVQEFALRARIEAASVALLEASKTVAAVAQDFGFCDQSSFTRQFRQQTGATPGAFQRRYRGR